ncbi:unnamed protein product [Arctia plantaginis]|uniref:Single domain major allergen protein n=2 Tax=Arctia plantaginis TaxID=874455 RepID=A0A8S1AEU5_ARCPL|nr:unnamed protein product [Arctia plantaginis]
MMKQAVIVLAVLGIAFSAPQPRKQFSEHVSEFLNIIEEEAGDEIYNLMQQYLEFEEFRTALAYTRSTNFRDLIYEMEDLPEFNAVLDFLEKDNIDIHTFIDLLNEILEDIEKMKRNTRQSVSGTTMTDFIYDSIAVFPTAKLSALFDEKMANDEAFSTALINLRSEEFSQLANALFENEIFRQEIQSLRENGVEIEVLMDEVLAIFGQTLP